MSIQILKQSATLEGLQDQGTPARPLSQPPWLGAALPTQKGRH